MSSERVLLVHDSYCVLVHGGAGAIDDADIPEHVAGCEEAAARALAVLAAGGSALDAVELAVSVLEDNPRFNAGTGGSLNEDGDLELDASIMSSDGRAGAVACLPPFAHPISIARRVLESGEHVLFVSEGAARFARAEGFAPSTGDAMITERARARLVRAQGDGVRTSRRALESDGNLDADGNTVGAVAFDTHGAFAAATSTGGTTNKRKGRVGDSPILGAGNYAGTLGAASATGDGEAFMRHLATKTVLDRIDRTPLDHTLAEVLVELETQYRGYGGLIALGKTAGAIARTTPTMPWAFASEIERRSGS